ncbi:schlafen family member 13-like [Engraulis encrasicolus]|uniref:schlafen family member 13-like n=1 Tax=Engraulis encrasicolus TaxID=184585 RepID=UPI002FD37255
MASLTVVKSQDFPDLEIKCCKSITFGEAKRGKLDKSKRESERECILIGVCSLLNSGGGVMTVDVANLSYDYKTEGMGLDIEEHLEILVGSGFEDMIESIPRDKKDKVKRNPDMDVGKPPAKRLASALPGNDIIKLKADEFFKMDSVNYGERLEFGESLHVELKEFRGEKVLTRLKEAVPKYISAFANTDGGYMFIGVTDKNQKVVGCCHGTDEAKLCRTIEELCERPKAVHMSGCRKRTDWPPEYRLIRVTSGKSSEAYGYVVAIKIPLFCCAVFEKDPNSWQVESWSDKIVRLEAEAWLEKLQLTDPDPDFCERFQNVVSLQNSPPLCKSVYSIQRLTQLQKKLFPVPENGVRVVPKPLRDKLNVHLTESLEGPGICILSQSWAVDLNLPKNEDVVYEALVICMGMYPTLYCFVEKDSPELKRYARDTAFHLKQKLVNLGGYAGKLCVRPKLVETQDLSEIKCSWLYPNSYRLNQENDLKALLCSLGVVLLSFTSPLSDELGCEVFNLLTKEQFGILHNYDGFNHLFIHGVPGSGKTLIAMEQIRRIKNLYGCEERNILYISENVGLKNFVGMQAICQCTTRAKFMSPSVDLSGVQHIIVDEAQNFRVEETGENWYEKAKGLVGDEGMFWVFLDYYQKNHTFNDGLPLLTSQNKVKLHKVVRNSTKVMDAMWHKMDEVIDGPQNFLTKHLAGMHKKIELSHSFQGKFQYKEVPPNKVMETVNQILHRLSSQGHSPGDIAMLFSTQKHLETTTARYEMKTQFPISSVDDMSTNKMVLDTVRRFSGLERNIVILVNPSVPPFFKDKERCGFGRQAYSAARRIKRRRAGGAEVEGGTVGVPGGRGGGGAGVSG